MSKQGDKNYVSVWFWMLALFVMAIPFIGIIMVIVWAFVGENQTRKNYFRAIIAWFLIFFLVWMSLFLFGYAPEITRHFHAWWKRFQ
jgi:hypothetical protein